VSEQELREHFEANRDSYGEPERRTVLQLVFNSQEEANLGRADINAGKSFAELAQAQGRTMEDVRLENKTLTELAVPLGDDAAKAAFALAQGEVSAPVKGRFGWLLLKAESVSPARLPSFEDARQKIHDEITDERASEQLFEVANELEDSRASGASLEEGAKAASVEAVTVETLDAEGKDRSGAPVPGLTPEILREAFSQDENFDADLKPLPDGGYFVVRVNKISPSAIRPFEEVSGRVAEDALREERAKRLAAFAKSLAERVERGTSLDALAKELRLTVQASDPIQRGTSNETFSREVVEKLFSAEIDDVVWGPVGLGESMLLLQLTNMRTPDPILDQAAYDSVRNELSKAIANDAEFALSDALQEQYEVRINARALEQLSGES
jgi:peptidyl-prolyl cis-trans isomerase D